MKIKLLFNGLLFAVTTLMFASCTKNSLKKSPQPDAGVACAKCGTEVAFAKEAGKEVVFNYNGGQVSVTQKGDKYILGGDMILSPQQIAKLKGTISANERTAVNSLSALWPNHTVFYTINANLPDQWRVTDAIAHWQANTNLVFVARTTQANYVEFFSGDGCYSNYGMIGGHQLISIGTDCGTGNAIHEIGHVIGFYHEHMRSDRDNSVTVNFANIIAGYEDNFKKYTELGRGGLELQGMDFNSVMLYGSYAFSSNGLPTMVRRGDNATFEGQRVGLSQGDIDTYNYLYNRPYLAIVKKNNVIVDETTQRGRRWDVYVNAYTDATKTTPVNLPRNLEVHYVVNTNNVTSNGYFTFAQGTNTFYLGKGYTLTNLVGTKYTNTQDFGLRDLIQ